MKKKLFKIKGVNIQLKNVTRLFAKLAYWSIVRNTEANTWTDQIISSVGAFVFNNGATNNINIASKF
jgi:hypothetical protein